MHQPTTCSEDVKDESWAKVLREFRQKHGLSRTQAAKAWGLDWRTIEAWEQGRRNPAGLYRERLEKIFKRAGLDSFKRGEG